MGEDGGNIYRHKRPECVGTCRELEKRQCTVQLTTFADGVAREKPLLPLHGKASVKLNVNGEWQDEEYPYLSGKHTISTLMRRCSSTAGLSRSCNEDMMRYRMRYCWKPACQDQMHLALDMHRTQGTDAI